ncbi:hypothetical protein ACUNV4_15355 [Granulosicoccus sp. 3-233]|uniref:hypothetical protein n=1 Tax=Granulosicoccus sp. 3-233 TaxID=3417969 RepID=UPI003D32DA90
MKIQLSSTLPFTPVQLDSRHDAPRRAVGQLFGFDGTREFRTAVYEFSHGDDDRIQYQIDPRERVYLDDVAANDADAPALPVDTSDNEPDGSLEWVTHDESLTYKPYAFLVMNAMTKLVGQWDGVVYQAPSGERLRDSVWNATLQVVDACVCNKLGLWVKVDMAADKGTANETVQAASRSLGWVPLQATAS